MTARILILVLALAIPSAGFAKEGSALKGHFKDDEADKYAPLKVTSNQMVTDNKKNTIVFTGSVIAEKGKLTLKADKVTLWTNEDQTDFTEMEAVGSVVITKEDKIATGKVAHYYAAEDKIILTGDPVLKDGKQTATGTKVVYYFDREDMEIYGDKKSRSTVILFPNSKEEKKKKKAAKGAGEIKKKTKTEIDKAKAKPGVNP